LTAAFTVRPAAPADFDQWLPLWAGYNRFYGREAVAEAVTRTTGDASSTPTNRCTPWWPRPPKAG